MNKTNRNEAFVKRSSEREVTLPEPVRFQLTTYEKPKNLIRKNMENSYYNHANRAYFLCKSYLFVKFFVIFLFIANVTR